VPGCVCRCRGSGWATQQVQGKWKGQIWMPSVVGMRMTGAVQAAGLCQIHCPLVTSTAPWHAPATDHDNKAPKLGPQEQDQLQNKAARSASAWLALHLWFIATAASTNQRAWARLCLVFWLQPSYNSTVCMHAWSPSLPTAHHVAFASAIIVP
jgi:hypothetical protein